MVAVVCTANTSSTDHFLTLDVARGSDSGTTFGVGFKILGCRAFDGGGGASSVDVSSGLDDASTTTVLVLMSDDLMLDNEGAGDSDDLMLDNEGAGVDDGDVVAARSQLGTVADAASPDACGLSPADDDVAAATCTPVDDDAAVPETRCFLRICRRCGLRIS